MQDKTISVVLTMHNQASIIGNIVNNLIRNCSDQVKEYIFIFDGCNDGTQQIVKDMCAQYDKTFIFKETPNIWETKANNFGFKLATGDYILTLQDDMLVTEKNFDQRMLKPFAVRDDILGVTARNAQNERVVGNSIECYDVAGKDRNSPRNIFSIRSVIVRGPIMFDRSKLAMLNYLDEDFAPLDCDDKDLSYRAYREHKWIVGSYVINYNSPLHWGKTRNNITSNQVWVASVTKNIQLIINRHSESMAETHNEDIIIEE